MNVYPIRCQIRAEADITRIDIYDAIDSWGGDFGLSAKTFAAQLADVKGALEVHINSGGGDVFDGLTIGRNLARYKGKVTTVVDGLAASIASAIAQAGDERVMEPGSMLMIHDAWGACVGNAADMAKFAADLDKNSDNIANLYAARAGGDADGWRDVMRAETWYTAEEAVAAGLADKVGGSGAELPAGMDLDAYTLPGRIAAALRSLPRAGQKSCADNGHQCCRDAQARSDEQIRAIVRDEFAALNDKGADPATPNLGQAPAWLNDLIGGCK